jgi:hypothetical protein
MTAGRKPEADPFNRRPRNLCERLIAQLDRSRQSRDDAVIGLLPGRHG